MCERGRDRHGQVRSSGLRPRRHRDRPEPPHPRPRGRRHRPGRSTPSASTCPSWPRRWTAWSARPPPSSSAGSAAVAASSTSRASGPATRIPTPLLDEIAELARRQGHAAGCRRSTASRCKPELVGQRIRRSTTPASSRARAVTPAAHRGPRRRHHRRPSSTCSSSRARSCRPSTSPRRVDDPLNLKTLRPPARPAGDRRRLRQLPGRPPPHAHRRGRRPRRRRRRASLHHPRRARHRRARRPPPSPTPGPPACATSTRPACTSTSSPTAAWRTGGDIAKAIVCGADAVMLGSPLAAAHEAPGRGYHWGMATVHPTLPRGARVKVGTRRHARGDPRRPGPRERRPHEPLRRAAHVDGHLRLRDAQGVPEGRGHGRAGAADRGQGLQQAQGVGMGH